MGVMYGYVIFWLSFRYRSGYNLGHLVGSKSLQNNDSGKPCSVLSPAWRIVTSKSWGKRLMAVQYLKFTRHAAQRKQQHKQTITTQQFAWPISQTDGKCYWMPTDKGWLMTKIKHKNVIVFLKSVLSYCIIVFPCPSSISKNKDASNTTVHYGN